MDLGIANLISRSVFYSIKSAPDRNRTCNPRIRNPMLYPIELRGHLVIQEVFFSRQAAYSFYISNITYKMGYVKYFHSFLNITRLIVKIKLITEKGILNQPELETFLGKRIPKA